ncbi:peptidyl-prolyl cis-trans isomerase [Alistipes sp. CAG:831]|nr:peptidyl-prolyl cis-trans isomerase [Alistipes sp. CAG:831]
MKSKIFALILLVSLTAASCGNRNSQKTSSDGTAASEATTDTTENTKTMDSNLAFDPASLPEEPIFEIHTTEGTITILLYADTPLHRDNFVKLASQHYYDSVLFHRVIYNFMIQTGDPNTKDPSKEDEYGNGGPDYTIPAEIIPAHTHKKGAVAAARLGDTANPRRESSGSQFYIVQSEEGCSHLNGAYTVFGETLDGFEVIDRIASLRTNAMDRPLKDVRIISITPVL